MKPKLFVILVLLLFQLGFANAEQIISGFGLFYKTSYDSALKQLESDGFKILKESVRKDTNTDRKIIEVSSFDYDGLPYKNGIFNFDRGMDGGYYFTISEGDVDTDKIDANMEYAIKFHIFLESCKEKYSMKKEETSYSQLIGFRAENNGYIILSISEKLHIAYFPKEPIR